MSPVTSCSTAILQDVSTTKTVVDKSCRNPVEQKCWLMLFLAIQCSKMLYVVFEYVHRE